MYCYLIHFRLCDKLFTYVISFNLHNNPKKMSAIFTLKKFYQREDKQHTQACFPPPGSGPDGILIEAIWIHIRDLKMNDPEVPIGQLW